MDTAGTLYLFCPKMNNYNFKCIVKYKIWAKKTDKRHSKYKMFNKFKGESEKYAKNHFVSNQNFL